MTLGSPRVTRAALCDRPSNKQPTWDVTAEPHAQEGGFRDAVKQVLTPMPEKRPCRKPGRIRVSVRTSSMSVQPPPTHDAGNNPRKSNSLSQAHTHITSRRESKGSPGPS